jgi:hypothetical protein
MENLNNPVRNQIIDHLKTNSIVLNFQYDPFGESTIHCEPNIFSSFFNDAFFDYIFNTGDPISGVFKVGLEQNQIIAKSLVVLDNQYSDILSKGNREILITKIKDTYSIEGQEWYFTIELSRLENNYSFNLNVFQFHSIKKDFLEIHLNNQNEINKIEHFLKDSIISQENCYELFLTNSGDPEFFKDYSNIKLIL